MLKHDKFNTIDIKEYSDESHSTEHDATVTLSEHDDNNSLYSDTFTVTSKSSKINDAKRLAYKLNKLKEENAMLKESLSRANVTDLTNLRAKLRGCNVDLVRVKQHNSELKDRVQQLEERLFNALNNANNNSSIPSISTRLQKLSRLAKKMDTSDETPEHSGDNELITLRNSMSELQNKYSALQKQSKSYQRRIAAMQLELDKTQQAITNRTPLDFTHTVIDNKQSTAEQNSTNSAPNSPTRKDQSNSSRYSNKPVFKYMPKEIQKTEEKKDEMIKDLEEKEKVIMQLRNQLQQSRMEGQSLADMMQQHEDDSKLINELSTEVRRLVSLLPRDYIDTDEISYIDDSKSIAVINYEESENDSTISKHMNGNNSNNNRDNGLNLSIDDSNDSNSEVTYSPQQLSPVSPNSYQRQKYLHRISNRKYSAGMLLCSFFTGIVIMLLCVFLSSIIGIN